MLSDIIIGYLSKSYSSRTKTYKEIALFDKEIQEQLKNVDGYYDYICSLMVDEFKPNPTFLGMIDWGKVAYLKKVVTNFINEREKIFLSTRNDNERKTVTKEYNLTSEPIGDSKKRVDITRFLGGIR